MSIITFQPYDVKILSIDKIQIHLKDERKRSKYLDRALIYLFYTVHKYLVFVQFSQGQIKLFICLKI